MVREASRGTYISLVTLTSLTPSADLRGRVFLYLLSPIDFSHRHKAISYHCPLADLGFRIVYRNCIPGSFSPGLHLNA